MAAYTLWMVAGSEPLI